MGPAVGRHGSLESLQTGRTACSYEQCHTLGFHERHGNSMLHGPHIVFSRETLFFIISLLFLLLFTLNSCGKLKLFGVYGGMMGWNGILGRILTEAIVE